MKCILGMAAIVAAAWMTPAAAQTCDDIYVVQSGDSLSAIADRIYKDAGRWVRLHRENAEAVGGDPDTLRIGTRLRVECLETEPAIPAAAAAPRPVDPLDGSVLNLVTTGDFAPFADRGLDHGGLIADIVDAVMQETGRGASYRLNWINDRSAHLDPLMRDGMMDMAFPWYRPDCDAVPQDRLCTDFLFSDPMFEVVGTLFTASKRPIPFAEDRDLEGRTLCRPAGYSLHDLDRPDRAWIRDGKIKLVQPDRVEGCFDLLMDGTVEAVAINDFTGRSAITRMKLAGQVTPVRNRAVSVETLHVLVAQSHPDVQNLMASFNDGLRRIRENGRFQEVMNRHLRPFWAVN